MGFLDNIFKDDKGKGGGGGKGGGVPNPFANLGGGKKAFKGQGNSLGGSKPGEVISVTLPHPGPLGVRVEKKTNNDASAVVNQVVPGSQAEAAGLQRGDVLCYAGTNGQEEIMYDIFLQLARSEQRPIQMEVRRLATQSSDGKQAGGTAANAASAAGSSSSSSNTGNNTSADAEVRRRAVIAAAEAREKIHKSKSKPIRYVTKSTLARATQHGDNASTKDEPLSEASRVAATIAKQDEAALAAQLGYNPYEAAKSTAGQARTATTAVQHGAIMSGGGPAAASSSSSPAAGGHLPVVAEPANPTGAVEEEEPPFSSTTPLPNEFEVAYATVLSLPDAASSQSSMAIMRKLIVNATTKGQQSHLSDESSKFRKVRLSNPKIKSAIVDVSGAIDIMLAVGFSLEETDDGESCLIYPADYAGPEWLSGAFKRMEQR